jgi:hypothetical protein
VLAMTLIVALAVQAPSATRWHLPVTIKVLQDVPVRSDSQPFQQRGVLYVGSKETAFVIPKDQTFQMISVGSAGGCRIRFEKQERDVSSCPWLDGFRDHQADIFNVVPDKSKAQRE